MKHFFTSRNYYDSVDVDKESKDYWDGEYACKICGVSPSKIRKEESVKVMDEKSRIEHEYHTLPPLELLINPSRWIFEKVDKQYEAHGLETQECPHKPPHTVKTKDPEYVSFLTENGYEIHSVIPLGRENGSGGGSSSFSESSGFFGIGAHSEGESNYGWSTTRRDIAEYTLTRINEKQA